MWTRTSHTFFSKTIRRSADTCGRSATAQKAKPRPWNNRWRENLRSDATARYGLPYKEDNRPRISPFFFYHDVSADLLGSGLVAVSFDTGGELAKEFVDAWFQKADAAIKEGLSNKEDN